MIVAVTGATGIVGRFVIERLVAEDAGVRALARPGSNRAGLPPDVDWVVGDMADSVSRRRLVEGADAVVHCAYQHEPGRYRGGEGDDLGEFWRANLQAGVELMREARTAGSERFVLLSSRAVFGQPGAPGQWVDDETRPVPDTFYGALKLALEAHVSAFSATEGACYASLRPTGIYGITVPVERSKWFDLAMKVRNGESLPSARLATEVHGEDVASGVWLMLSASSGQVAGRAFNCSDLVVDTRDVMAGLSQRLGVAADLPEPAANTVRNPMRTPALNALGWRGGGEGLLERTLDELATAAAEAGP